VGLRTSSGFAKAKPSQSCWTLAVSGKKIEEVLKKGVLKNRNALLF